MTSTDISPVSACRDTHEPMAGTAPRAATWWLIEAPGTWGPKAPASSSIAGLRDLTSGDDRRVLLVRRTIPTPPHDDLTLWVADAAGAEPVGYRAQTPDDLITWSTEGLDPRARIDAVGPRLLICTNSARDVCCGIAGRALIRALGARDRLWECSHLGGHRFSPTALQPIHGMVYGRLTVAAAALLLDDADLVEDAALNPDLTSLMRGSPALDALDQVLQIEVLRRTGKRPKSWSVVDPGRAVAHGPFGEISLRFEYVQIPPRPVSCGKPAEPGAVWQVVT